jgi:hypothetical protein
MNFIQTNTLFDWAGMLGVAFYILSYALLQFGVVRGSSYAYALMNLAAASLVLVSLMINFNLPSALIQISWIAISTVGLIRIYLMHSRIRFNDEEAAFIREALPDMPKTMARKMLDCGVWSDAEPGLELTTEGETVRNLHYISGGSAEVILDGQNIATIKAGLVGEMNVMVPGPASATVQVSAPARLLTFSGEALRAMAAGDTEFRAFLELHLSKATRTKLIAANTRLKQSWAEPEAEGASKARGD